METPQVIDQLKNRFMSGLPKDIEPTKCWIWQGSLNRVGGYGRPRVGGKRRMLAHRISWTLFNGRIPFGMFVCHACDTPACVNPDHLFLGTAGDNHRDMVLKNRQYHPKGQIHPNAKLNDNSVTVIKSLVSKGLSQSEVARQFGVTRKAVNHIIRKRTWIHL